MVVKPTSAGGAIKYTLETTSAATVLDLKELVAQAANITVGEQRLIYKGQILKDDRTLESYSERATQRAGGSTEQTPLRR